MSSPENRKKRKRSEDDDDNKLTATLRVKEVGPGEITPVIAAFPNGPPHRSVLHNGKDGLCFTLWKSRGASDGALGNASSTEHAELRASAEDYMVEYVGRDFGPSSHRTANEKYVIGVFNKSKNKIMLVPVYKMFHMERSIRGLEVPEEEVVDEEPELKNLTDLQRKRLAQARVGNKRAKAIVRNMIVNALSTKNTVAIDPSAYSLSEEYMPKKSSSSSKKKAEKEKEANAEGHEEAQSSKKKSKSKNSE